MHAAEPRPTPEPEAPADRLLFRRRHRLSRDRDYQAVFAARAMRRTGPISVFTKPNDLPLTRLGLSIGRRFGKAHERVALKRRLREAFRHVRPELPAGYDVVITAGAHRPLKPKVYARLIREAVGSLHRQWSKRESSSGGRHDAS